MELNFKTYGTEGPALFILHGLFGSLDNWHTLATRFSKHMRVFAVDQRNHGRSAHAEGNSYNLMSEDFLELMEKLGIERAYVLGHSMGGKTAMQFAFDHPDKVEKLIVADIAPKAYPSRHSNEIEAMLALDLESLDKRSEADEQMKPFIPDFGVRQFLLKNLVREKSGGYKWKINLPELIKEYSQILAAVESYVPFEQPTLFIAGGRSRYIQPEDRDSISRLFTNTSFSEIADAGHWLHAEQPDEFYDLVVSFLDIKA